MKENSVGLVSRRETLRFIGAAGATALVGWGDVRPSGLWLPGMTGSVVNRFVALPIDLGPSTDRLFVVGFGTGFRYRSSLSGVTATIGGTDAEVVFAGAQGTYQGLDQTNIAIPRSLAGRGDVDLVFRVDGTTANTVSLNIK